MDKLFWKTEKRKIKDLELFPDNPRTMTKKQAEDLIKSLKNFNLAELPCVDHKDRVIAGNMRISALKKMGRGDEVIEVRVPSRELTEGECREYLIRSNKNTGSWDWDLLASDWGKDELIDFGFDSGEVDKMFSIDLPVDLEAGGKGNKVKTTCPKCGFVWEGV